VRRTEPGGIVSPPRDARVLASEACIPTMMPQSLGTLNLTAIFTVAVFWMINATTAAFAGPVAFVFLGIAGFAFLLPAVLAIAQLGKLYPHEGSVYNWTYHALGKFWAFFVGVCFWIPGPLAQIIAGSAAITYLQGLHPTWLTEPWQQGAVMLTFILCVRVLSSQQFRMVQMVVTLVFVFLLLDLGLIATAGGVWLGSCHVPATNFGLGSNWQPTGSNLGLFGLIALAYLGTQVGMNMGGEIRSRLAITRHLLVGTLIVTVGYFLSTFSLLVVRGPAILSSSNPNFELVTMVNLILGSFFGHVVAIGMLVFFLLAAVVYNVSSTRLLLAASLDERLPSSFKTLSEKQVPITAVRLQTWIAIALTVLAYGVPYLVPLSNPANLSNEVYNVVLCTMTIIWIFGHIFLFVDVFVLLRGRVQHHRAGLFPSLMLWYCISIGPTACLVVIVDSLVYSWTPQIPNTSWWFIVGACTLVCLFLVFIGSLFASTEVRWQKMQSS
jgi:glutamate:GABA antiporter